MTFREARAMGSALALQPEFLGNRVATGSTGATRVTHSDAAELAMELLGQLSQKPSIRPDGFPLLAAVHALLADVRPRGSPKRACPHSCAERPRSTPTTA